MRLMRVRIAIIAAGLALALVLPAAPAGAVTKTVRALPDNVFSPASVFIRPGDTVRFVNLGGEHNVAWRGGAFPTEPNPANTTAWTVTRPFPSTTPNRTFGFFCTVHADAAGTEGMIGRVVVDRTAPTVTRVGATPGRSRVTLRFRSSEAGTVVGTILRRSGRSFRALGPTTFPARSGDNVRTLTRTSEGRSSDRLTPGVYRITFRVRDAAGNRSSLKTVNFTIVMR
jgi:plastocyanin